ncbi:MAG: hypothetical protein U0796_19030 [Gemmatales bacterium]
MSNTGTGFVQPTCSTHATITGRFKVDESPTNTKASFWKRFTAIQYGQDENDGITDDDYEGQIRTVMPLSLMWGMNGMHVGLEEGRRILSRGEDVRTFSHRVVVACTSISYSSIGIGLAFEPIEKLAELFDHNFHYFDVFLRQYAPMAFHQAIGRRTRSNPASATNQMEFSVSYDPNFIDSFKADSPKKTKSASKKHGVLQKANWLWIVSNCSLLVPVALLSWYYYCIHSNVTTRQGAIDKSYEELIKIQSDTIKNLAPEPKKPSEKTATQPLATAPLHQAVPAK